MTNNSDNNLANSSRSGLISLSARSILINFLKFFSTIFLAKLLSKEDFAIFGIINGWLISLLYFTDIGFGDILSRKKDELTTNDLSFLFSVRITLSILMAIIFAIASPYILAHYELSFKYSQYTFLLGLIIPIIVTSAIPVIFYERNLDFKFVAIADLLSALVLYFVQISVAFLGFKSWSFFTAIILSNITKSIFLFRKIKLHLKISFKHSELLKEIKTGAFFQLSSIFQALSSIITPFIFAVYLPTEMIGLYFWMEALVKIPLVLIFNYNQVFFLTLSKASVDPSYFKIMASRALENMIFLVVLIFTTGAIASPGIIKLLFDEKWFIAIQYMPYLCLYMLLYSLRYLGNSILTGMGESKSRAANEVYLAIFNNILILIGTKYFGFMGVFYGFIASSIINIFIMWLYIRKWMSLNVYKRLFASSFAAVIGYKSLVYFEINAVFLTIPFFVLIYTVCSVMIDYSVKNDIEKIINRILKR